MRKLDLNLEENDNYISGRGRTLDFNFDNAIGGSLTTPYVPSSTYLSGSLTTPYTPKKTGLGSSNTSLISDATKSIMDRIKEMSGKTPKFNPITPSTTAKTTTLDKTSETKKSKMPIALIGGGVVVVGVIMYFIFKK